jgi:hypothetical protein
LIHPLQPLKARSGAVSGDHSGIADRCGREPLWRKTVRIPPVEENVSRGCADVLHLILNAAADNRQLVDAVADID